MTELNGRFLQFSKDTIIFCKGLKLDTISRPIVSQLVRSSTSIGANYSESQSGISKKDFRSKVYISLKEAEESKYWFEILITCFPEKKPEINTLLSEIQQIIKILQTIVNKVS